MKDPISTFLGCLAIGALASGVISCSSDDPVNVNSRIFLVVGNTLTPQGGGCTHVKLPGDQSGLSGGSTSGDFSYSEGPQGENYVVRVFSDQELLATRSYPSFRLRTNQVDEFSVTMHSGSQYVFRYWGGPCTDLNLPKP